MLTMEQIWSRLATNGLMVAVSLMVHVTVGVLSLPVSGAHHAEDVHTVGKVALWSISADNSRSELVIRPVGLLTMI